MPRTALHSQLAKNWVLPRQMKRVPANVPTSSAFWIARITVSEYLDVWPVDGVM